MSVRGDVELLRLVPLFSSVDAAQLQILVFSAERPVIPTGEYVLKKGQSDRAGFLVLGGHGEAYTGQGISPVAKVERGAFLGELQMVARLPASLSVVARADMQVMKIPHELFMRVCAEFPESAGRMLGVLSRKLETSVKDLRTVQRFFEGADAKAMRR